MNIFQRWKAPTPAFFKKIFRVSLLAAAGATACLMAGTIGGAVIPGFTWTLHPWANTLCKNLVVAGLVAAAIAKAAKIDVAEQTLTIKKTTTTDAEVVTEKTETNFSNTEPTANPQKD